MCLVLLQEMRTLTKHWHGWHNLDFPHGNTHWNQEQIKWKQPKRDIKKGTPDSQNILPHAPEPSKIPQNVPRLPQDAPRIPPRHAQDAVKTYPTRPRLTQESKASPQWTPKYFQLHPPPNTTRLLPKALPKAKMLLKGPNFLRSSAPRCIDQP